MNDGNMGWMDVCDQLDKYGSLRSSNSSDLAMLVRLPLFCICVSLYVLRYNILDLHPSTTSPPHHPTTPLPHHHPKKGMRVCECMHICGYYLSSLLQFKIPRILL